MPCSMRSGCGQTPTPAEVPAQGCTGLLGATASEDPGAQNGYRAAVGDLGYVPQGRERFLLLSVEENLRVARTSVT